MEYGSRELEVIDNHLKLKNISPCKVDSAVCMEKGHLLEQVQNCGTISLPLHIRMESNIYKFKKLLKSSLLIECDSFHNRLNRL